MIISVNEKSGQPDVSSFWGFRCGSGGSGLVPGVWVRSRGQGQMVWGIRMSRRWAQVVWPRTDGNSCYHYWLSERHLQQYKVTDK